jgi:uroporphyrinogen-III decarboxylase
MNTRERFLACLRFEPVDRLPLMDVGVWDEALQRWHHEGLPKWVTQFRHLEDYLGLDRSWNVNWLEIDDLLYPRFQAQILSETAEEQIVRDEVGVTLRQRKAYRTIPQFIRFPVENEADYEALLPQLNGADPGRYAADFAEDLFWRRQRGEIIGVSFAGFFGFPRGLMGMENWCLAFYDQPHLVRRIIADRLHFASDLYARLFATETLDFVQIWEDMAYNAGPLIAPRLVREFMLPAYAELVQLFRRNGVKLIMVDSDGRANDLVPIFREAGIDGVHPCEIAAGADPVLIRAENPGCALQGGMDKRLIAAGREGIDAELRRLQPLLQAGGFIPMLDHFVPPDVSYESFCYYVQKRRELCYNPGARI